MGIWKTAMTLESIAKIREHTLVSLMGIEFIEIGDNYLKGKMPVDHRTMQPYGIMHGGASCVLAETLGSIAATHCVDVNKKLCVGLDIHTNHLRMVKSGYVIGTATPIQIGNTIQVWEIRIENEENKLVSVTRLTLAVIDRR